MAYKDFSELQAVRQLQMLAQTPYDLTLPGALSPTRIEAMKASACGFELLYATQRLDQTTMTALQALADEAQLIHQFKAMKQGAILNRIEGYASEERQVLHTSCRDLFSEHPHYPPATAQAKAELDKLRRFLSDLEHGQIGNSQGESFVNLVQVGIGGSDLGPRALSLALDAFALPQRKAHFIANVDPDDAASVLCGLDLSRTLFNIVSKSGSTLETQTNEELVRAALAKAGLEARRHLVAVTGEGSPMDDPSRYLASFYMRDYIGGRYSATSMVGALSLGFTLGYETLIELLRGAWEMDEAAEEPDIKKNPPLLMALLGVWNHNFLGHATCAVLPYSQALARFPAHLQQCDMESNGKSVTRQGQAVRWQTGPVVWGEPGTNGQHAFYQLMHQGTEIVPAEFIGFRDSQYGLDLEVQATTSQQKLIANMLAQALALALGQENDNPARRFPGNRPSSILIAQRLSPYQMGALLALYEHRIAFQGFCWNINSFDQEGVQLGKGLAATLLRLLAQDREGQTQHDGEGSGIERSLLAQAGLLGRSAVK